MTPLRRTDVDMDQRDLLGKLAEDRIMADSGAALDSVGQAAARLLADLYTVGLEHGVTPQDWAAVTALPGACWDAARALARRQLLIQDRASRLANGQSQLPRPDARSVDRPGRGRAR